MMKKRFLGLCTILVLCVVLSITAWADGQGLVITGGTLGEDYAYENGVVTVKTATALTIQNADGVTTTTDHIVVQSDVSANITLAGVNIDVRGDGNACAFEIASGGDGTVTVTLADDTENTLISGMKRAGLEKNDTSSTLVIQCKNANTTGHTCTDACGKLTAQSGDGVDRRNGSFGQGAGIGSAYKEVYSPDVSNIKIIGGTIIAESCAGAGIGSGDSITFSGAVSNIEIRGGMVIAESFHGAGIGSGGASTYSGAVSNITITNSTVTLTAVNGGIGASYIGSVRGETSAVHITNSSVKYIDPINGEYGTAIGCTPDNGDADTPVYLLTIENPSGAPIIIDGQAIPTAPHGDDTNRYVYLPAGTYTVTSTNETHTVTVAANNNNKLKLKAFEITGGTLGEDYAYENGVVTVLTDTALTIENLNPAKATTDHIVVQSGVSANITLAGVNIDVRNYDGEVCAFEIASGGDGTVTVTLADDTENTLISGMKRAGLEKNDTSSTLVIQCKNANTTGHTCTDACGKLTAQSGDGVDRIRYLDGAAAGIGSAYNDRVSNSVSNIMIKGGTIIAESYAGAGIGSGVGTPGISGDASNIRITGGIVYATSVNGGAIGSGYAMGESGDVSNITIMNSTVTLASNHRGIGSGIGSVRGETSAVHITNSSVKCNGSGLAIGCTPDNGAGENVYLLTIENPSGAPIIIDGQAIPTAPHGDDLTRYAYVTGEDHMVFIGTTHQQAKFDSDTKTFTWENIEHDWSDWVKDGGTKTHTRTCQIVGCGFTETKEHTYTNGVCICGDTQYNTTVTFDANGGSVRPTSLETGADGKLTSLPTPTRRDYNFQGWFTKDGAQVTTDTVFTESTTVYAHWTVKASALLPTWQEWELIDKIVEANKKKDEVVDEPEVEEPVDEPTETEPTETEPEAPVKPWNNPFADVSESDAFYEAVKFAFENGYMNGMSDDTFAPNDSLTRAMLVTVLYRAAGSPAVEDANPFADVAEDAWYHNAVVWAKSIGLVNGISATEFAPEDELTREQLVTIFYRYAAFLGYDLSIGEDTNILSYEDFDAIAEYAIPALQWACGAGLLESVDGNLLPQDNATRALVAMVLLGMFA